MSACLLSQLTAPTKPAAGPLLLLLASPAAAQWVGERGDAQGGTVQSPWVTHCPGGKIPQGNWAAGPEEGPATLIPPAQTPCRLGGSTSQVRLLKCSSLCQAGAPGEGLRFPPSHSSACRLHQPPADGPGRGHHWHGIQPPRRVPAACGDQVPSSASAHSSCRPLTNGPFRACPAPLALPLPAAAWETHVRTAWGPGKSLVINLVSNPLIQLLLDLISEKSAPATWSLFHPISPLGGTGRDGCHPVLFSLHPPARGPAHHAALPQD